VSNLITINFYKDGAYITGHDINEICGIVSYAMWNCIENCMRAETDMHYYQSINDPEWSRLGLTYIKINKTCLEHKIELENFKTNITGWFNHEYQGRVMFNNYNEDVNWNIALEDAKNKL
jgi:hypothetical protein